MRAYQATATAIGLSFLLAMTGAAFAAPSSAALPHQGAGVTSGPADGNNVTNAQPTMKQAAKTTKDSSSSK
jgi:hypothetical protein